MKGFYSTFALPFGRRLAKNHRSGSLPSGSWSEQPGNILVIEAYQTLIRTNQASKNRNEYMVDFADFYVVLAKEYARAHPPDDRTFQWERFSQWTSNAWHLYADVAQKDGSLEKLEAQGKLQALQAYVSKVRTASQ